MALLDQVLGGLFGGNASPSPMQGVLGSLLGGGGGQYANQPSGIGGAGGIGGLLSAFEGAGLGHIAQSWVGTGPNQPVSPGQLQQVFGDQQINSMASQAGMERNDFLGQLAQHLPNAVDQMTPNGQVPNEGRMAV